MSIGFQERPSEAAIMGAKHDDNGNVTVTGDEALLIACALGIVLAHEYNGPLTEHQLSVRERCAALCDRFRKLAHELKSAEATSADMGFVIQGDLSG